MATHELKTWPEYFHVVASGRKNFEVRKDDRGFRGGDVVRLREWDPSSGDYTGREVIKTVSYVLTDDFPGLQPGYVAMALKGADDA